MDEVNPEEVDERAISERMTAWRQRCRQWRGEGGGLEEGAAAWRRGLGGNVREEARVFYVVFFILIIFSYL